jgi:hypothetical protein
MADNPKIPGMVCIPGTDDYIDAQSIMFVRYNPAASYVHFFLEPDNNQQWGGAVNPQQFKELMRDLSNTVMGRDVEAHDTAAERIGPKARRPQTEVEPDRFVGIVKFPETKQPGREGLVDYVIASRPRVVRLVDDKIVVDCKGGQQWDALGMNREQFHEFAKVFGAEKQAIQAAQASR